MKSKTDVILADILKASGYSITRTRQIVFKSLVNQEPMSMRALTEKIGSKTNRASVYRSIDLFEKLGIVQRLNYGWKYKIELTDKFSEHHHHMSCLGCGRVISINEQSLESFISQAAGDKGFVPSSHQVEIQGYCADCSIGLKIP